jgi:hypothetical protein
LGQVSEKTWTFARAGESGNVLKQNEVVAVNDFEALARRVECAQGDGLEPGERGDFLAGKIGFTTGEHGGVGACDVHDIARVEFPAGVCDADGEEAAAAFAEHGDGAIGTLEVSGFVKGLPTLVVVKSPGGTPLYKRDTDMVRKAG